MGAGRCTKMRWGRESRVAGLRARAPANVTCGWICPVGAGEGSRHFLAALAWSNRACRRGGEGFQKAPPHRRDRVGVDREGGTVGCCRVL